MRDVVRILGVPKHRIIYFCNEGVIKPLKDATGRGKVRLYSTQNLFELSLALTLMGSNISTEHAKLVVAAVRNFEQTQQKADSSFCIPESLVAAGAPELKAVIGDGQHLSFVLIPLGGQHRISSASLDLREEEKGANDKMSALSGMKIADSWKTGNFGQPEGSRFTRTEIGITQLARDLNDRLTDFGKICD